MVNSDRNPKNFFAEEQRERIVFAIRQAEEKTSGEIRVYLERGSKKDILERAQKVFEKLGMTRTEKRNGVLIYFSLADHRFAILGDQGINKKVGESFWKVMASEMERAFVRKDFVGGLEAGIRQIGETLRTHFPRQAHDINELPDEISG